MPIINSVPEKYRDGFAELATIEEDEFNKIQEALEQTPLVSSIDKLALKVYKKKEIECDLEDIFTSVSSVITFIESKENISEMATDITDLLIVAYNLLEDKDRNNLINRLSFLLGKEQLFYASKAEDLINNYGNSFILSRIVSDIRPVFDVDLDEDLKVGMIMHNLIIHYQSNDEPFHKNISLTLTPSNVRELREVLDRADSKEQKLQSLLTKVKLINLNE